LPFNFKALNYESFEGFIIKFYTRVLYPSLKEVNYKGDD